MRLAAVLAPREPAVFVACTVRFMEGASIGQALRPPRARADRDATPTRRGQARVGASTRSRGGPSTSSASWRRTVRRGASL